MRFVFVSFVFVLAIITTNEIKARELSASQRNQIALDCIKETGVHRGIVEEAATGNMPQNDTKYKNFLACSYKKQGYQSETGEILIENIKTFLGKYYNPADLTPLNVCSKFNDSNHGENAFNGLQCTLNHIKKITPKTN